MPESDVYDHSNREDAQEEALDVLSEVFDTAYVRTQTTVIYEQTTGSWWEFTFVNGDERYTFSINLWDGQWELRRELDDGGNERIIYHKPRR